MIECHPIPPLRIYGYNPGDNRPVETILAETQSCVAMCDGLATNITNGERLLDIFGQFCRDRKMDFIVGFTGDPQSLDEACIARVRQWTRRISIGNTKSGEFGGDGHGQRGVEIAAEYEAAAKRLQFEWVCPWTPFSMLQDFASGGLLRSHFVANQTLCISFTAQLLAAKLCGLHAMPHLDLTSLAGLVLGQSFGITPNKWREYIEPLNVISGAGGQAGLDVGSARALKRFGYKGLLISMPFVLPEGIR
mgnify:CR=1 FL=1